MPDDSQWKDVGDTLAKWFDQAALKVFASAVLDAADGASSLDIAIVMRANWDDPEREVRGHWMMIRNFKGAPELETFLEEARAEVSMWDHDPTHVKHPTLTIKPVTFEVKSQE